MRTAHFKDMGGGKDLKIGIKNSRGEAGKKCIGWVGKEGGSHTETQEGQYSGAVQWGGSVGQFSGAVQ